MKKYIALIHKDADSDYGVSFPDFPGCISAGSTFEEAIDNGTQALGEHVALMQKEGDEIPLARTLDQIKEAGEDLDGAMISIIQLVVPAKKSERLNISMDTSLVETIDHVSNVQNLTRSGFLAEAAAQYLWSFGIYDHSNLTNWKGNAAFTFNQSQAENVRQSISFATSKLLDDEDSAETRLLIALGSDGHFDFLPMNTTDEEAGKEKALEELLGLMRDRPLTKPSDKIANK